MLELPASFLALGIRTPIGRLRGKLASVGPIDLLATVLRFQHQSLSPDHPAIDRVIAANATNQAGNVARAAALTAGITPDVLCLTINGQCSGGLTAVRLGTEAVQSSNAQLVLAAGFECPSLSGDRLEHPLLNTGDQKIRHAPDLLGDPAMGPAADYMAAELEITRSEQDDYAFQSYRRASLPRAALLHQACRLSITLADGSSMTEDEMARRRPQRELFSRAKPAFGINGTVTAANCAPLGDGAASIAVGTEEALSSAGVPAAARIIAATGVGASPAQPAGAVLFAIDKVLSTAGMTAEQIDLWEINEAFAVKVIAAMRRWNLDTSIVNVNGGAISYGHPFGASGIIALIHALGELIRSGKSRALVAIAGAGGVAEAVIIERWAA